MTSVPAVVQDVPLGSPVSGLLRITSLHTEYAKEAMQSEQFLAFASCARLAHGTLLYDAGVACSCLLFVNCSLLTRLLVCACV